MADLTILLKYQKDDIYYTTHEGKEYRLLEEKTIIGADSGAKITWQCVDNSIRKITNIVVNLKKENDGNYGKIWESVPVLVPDTNNKCWTGQALEITGKPVLNGWIIHYITKDGQEKEKDPGITIPPQGH